MRLQISRLALPLIAALAAGCTQSEMSGAPDEAAAGAGSLVSQAGSLMSGGGVPSSMQGAWAPYSRTAEEGTGAITLESDAIALANGVSYGLAPIGAAGIEVYRLDPPMPGEMPGEGFPCGDEPTRYIALKTSKAVIGGDTLLEIEALAGPDAPTTEADRARLDASKSPMRWGVCSLSVYSRG